MTPDNSRQKLFVEAPTDGAVINKLVFLRLGVDLARPSSHRIVEAPLGDGGFERALARFGDALAARRPERLGLVVDRDGGEKPDRWSRVRQTLVRADLRPPDEPPGEGLRIDAPWGRVGAWLMPDNRATGDLESFLESLLPNPLPSTWSYATESVHGAKARGAPYQEAHRSKAVFHTWLAWQNPPGAPYGTALEAQILGVKVSCGRCVRRLARVALWRLIGSSREEPRIAEAQAGRGARRRMA